MPPFISLILRAFSPAIPSAHPVEAVRTAVGAVCGLLVVHTVLWAFARASGTADAGFFAHTLLVAPLGASVVLIFALPSSPMAQPWSVVAGNGISAICALIVLQLGLPELVSLCLAALLALVAMGLIRALHPPAGAVAVATVLGDVPGHEPGLAYLIVTIVLGSLLLTACGVAFHRVTGQNYPFRPAPAALPPEPVRQAPSPLVLAAALDQLRLGAVIGVEDVAQLIATAEEISAGTAVGLMADSIMSPAPISVGPGADWRMLSALFVDHGFRNLPVVDNQNQFMGLIPMQTILRPGAQGLSARHLMQDVATRPPDAPLADLLPPLAHGRQTALPIVDVDGTLSGIVTTSDIVAALVHRTAQTTQG